MAKKWTSDYVFVKDSTTKNQFIFLQECYGFTVRSKFLSFLLVEFGHMRDNNKYLHAQLRNKDLEIKMLRKNLEKLS